MATQDVILFTRPDGSQWAVNATESPAVIEMLRNDPNNAGSVPSTVTWPVSDVPQESAGDPDTGAGGFVSPSATGNTGNSGVPFAPRQPIGNDEVVMTAAASPVENFFHSSLGTLLLVLGALWLLLRR